MGVTLCATTRLSAGVELCRLMPPTTPPSTTTSPTPQTQQPPMPSSQSGETVLRCDGGRSEDLCVAAAATPPPPAGCSGHQDSGGGPRPARLEPPPLPAGSPSPRPAPDRHPLHPQSLPEANTLLDRSPLPSQGSLWLRSGRGCEPLKGSALRLHSCCNLWSRWAKVQVRARGPSSPRGLRLHASSATSCPPACCRAISRFSSNPSTTTLSLGWKRFPGRR